MQVSFLSDLPTSMFEHHLIALTVEEIRPGFVYVVENLAEDYKRELLITSSTPEEFDYDLESLKREDYTNVEIGLSRLRFYTMKSVLDYYYTNLATST